MNARRYGGAGIRRGVRAAGGPSAFPNVASLRLRYNAYSTGAYTLGTGPDVTTLHDLVGAVAGADPTNVAADATVPHLVDDGGVAAIQYSRAAFQRHQVTAAANVYAAGQYVAVLRTMRLLSTTVTQFFGALGAGNFDCTSRLTGLPVADGTFTTPSGLFTASSAFSDTTNYHVHRFQLRADEVVYAIDGTESTTAAAANGGVLSAAAKITVGGRQDLGATSFADINLRELVVLANSSAAALEADVALAEAWMIANAP